MKRNNMTAKISKELLETLIIEYRDNNMSLRGIEREYNVNRFALAKLLEQIGIKTTKGNHYRTFFHDFDYFEKINTHDKAYFLGLLMADGFITDNSKKHGEDSFGISLSIEDKYIIESFKKYIKSNNPIHEYTGRDYKQGFGSFYYVRIIMVSQKTVNDLMEKNVVKQKTLIKEFPDNNKVPDEFIYSYLRGYMDGNGSISLRETKSKGERATLSFTTSENFAIGLSKFGQCNISKDKRARAWNVSFRTGSSIDLLNKMYKNSTEDTRIERKYKKYLRTKNDE